MATATITPTDIQISAAQLKVGGTDIGSTTGGITFSPTVSVMKIFVDQSSMPVGHRITQEECQVTCNLSEFNITKLAAVTPGTTYTLDGSAIKKKLEVGGGAIATTDYVELIITPLTDGAATISTDANMVITVFKCIPFQQPQLAFTKDGIRYVPVVFDAMRDSTKAAGKQLYIIGDTTASA